MIARGLIASSLALQLLGCASSGGEGAAGGEGGRGGDPVSICGLERPCVPTGIWTVTYEEVPTNVYFSDNTIHIESDGRPEVVGETVPDNDCPPQFVGPGVVTTTAQLSADGCTLAATIEKDYCTSGEENCEERAITLDFCSNGSTTVATGSMRACICWTTGSPFCSSGDSFVVVSATATRPD